MLTPIRSKKRAVSRRCERYIPIALQISALTRGGAGVFGKGFDSRDAVTEPTWTYSRRPLTDTPAPKFDQQRV
ncbi:hypothetical protein EQU24_13855 [Methylotuvimicrobium buryatense]|uniref:Uncharacterized protein n=1 Tax=Methylotuvimicrobium buryatense TaxID=95641 RepID=A0A4P9UP78_METBY|nr:hypothetical protein EQU24_13855 [Methylotuvimicrobium buryatense]